jgi:preprotein translocase subunit SecA
MAMEGAEIEAQERGREVSPRELLRSIEENAGLRINVDESTESKLKEDLDALRQRVPELVEASMGLRVWAGMVQTVERRLGEKLGLERSLSIPIDWDQAAQRLQQALAEAWDQRAKGLDSDIRRDVERALRREEQVTEAVKLRLLVQMSYGERGFFDKKTHQRRTIRVARLSYAYGAARLIEAREPEDLIAEIMEHLYGARDALVLGLGYADLARLGGSSIDDLEARIRDAIRADLGDEAYGRARESDLLSALPEDLRDPVARVLGERIMTEGYRSLILSVGDRLWVDYLTHIEALRTSIGLEAYGQRDPLVQYKSRAYDMFQNLLVEIRAGVVSRLYRGQITTRPSSAAPAAAEVSGGRAAGKPSKRGRRRRRR